MRVIVVGAGLAGLTTAYFLMRQGAEVTVIDRAPGPGLGTSFANGAMLHASLVEPWNAPGVLWQILRWLGREDAPLLLRPRALPDLVGWGFGFLRNSSPRLFEANTQKNIRLALYSLRMMARIREQNELRYEHQRRGLLTVFRSEAGHGQRLQQIQALARLGLSIDVLDREALLALEPALAPIGALLRGGVHYRDDEGGDAHLFCAELSRVLSQQGATFLYGVAVQSLQCAQRRIRAIRCADRELVADSYVLAAGSDSTLLARDCGLHLPVRPVKGYSITMPRAAAAQAAPRIAIEDYELHAVVVPVGDERVRVAGTAELTGYDLSPNPRRIDNLKGLLRRMFPAYAEALAPADFEPWAGLRPMCADGVPLIGATPIDNLYLNTGHGHLGWTLAAGSGSLAADLMFGRTPAVAASDYAPGRFWGGAKAR